MPIVLSLSLLTAFLYWLSFVSNAAAQGRVAYWKLDETSGSTYADSEGSLDGACAGACPAPTTGGQLNGAQIFDGSSAGINIPADSLMDWGVDDSFSIELWVRGNSLLSCVASDETFMGRADNGAGSGYWTLGCVAGTGNVNFQLGDSNNVSVTLTSSQVITDGLWHHIVATRDGVNDINYLTVDGTDVVSVTQNYTGILVPNTAVLSLGHLESSAHFRGALDEVTLYNGLVPTFAAPVITSTPDTETVVNQPYAYDIDATGFPTPTYSLLTYPTNMTIDSVSGVISWTPNSSQLGVHSVEAQAVNAFGVATQQHELTVVQEPTITSTPLTSAITNAPYSYNVDATGFPMPTYSLTITPTGMIINPTTGLVSWTPTSSGEATVNVQAANSQGTTSQMFTIDVVNSLVCLAADPIAYWQLDETSGTTFSDLVRSNNASCSGAGCPAFAAGRINGALDFDGVNNELDVADHASLDWNNGDSFSIQAWVQTTQACTGNNVYVGKFRWGSGGDWWLGCGNDNDEAVFYLRDSNSASFKAQSTTTISDGNWHHLTAVRDASLDEIRLYVDGVEETALSTAYTGHFSNGEMLTIGYFANLYHADGLIDEVAIHGRALTATEIQHHYNNGQAGMDYCTLAEPNIVSTPVTSGVVNNAYTYQVQAGGHPGPTYSLIAPPSGMSIDPITGLISWTPTSDGYFNVTVRATNSEGSDNQNFIIEATSPPVITSTPVTTADVGQPYSYDVDASGIPTPTYQLLNSPTGMTIDANSGVISWTPTIDQTGWQAVEVEAGNSAGNHTQTFIIVTTGPPMITSSPGTAVTVLTPYNYDVGATGYPTPTYDLIDGPAGMTINADSGLISWTPANQGTYSVTVQAINSQGTNDQSFNIEVVDSLVCLVSDPVAYWTLDETSGTTFADLINGNDANCSGVNCPAFASGGRANGALDFDGVDDGIDVSDHASLDWLISDSFTIQAWVKTTQSCAGTKVYIGKYRYASGRGDWWLGCGNNDTAAFYLHDSNNVENEIRGTTIINDGNWHHLVAVRDASSGENRLYVDGVEETVSTPNYTGNFANSEVLTIGYYANSYHTDGLVDEAAIHDRALTTTEIQQYYNNGLAGLDYCSLAAPVIVSTPTTGVIPSGLYVYDVESAGNPTPTFSLISGPPGMSIDPNTGRITWLEGGAPSGTPYSAEVKASNVAGTNHQTFTFIVYYANFVPIIMNSD